MAYALYGLYEHAKNERKMSLKYLDRYSLEQLKAMERCLSGLKRQFAKLLWSLKATEGSNPSLSAILKRV